MVSGDFNWNENSPALSLSRWCYFILEAFKSLTKFKFWIKKSCLERERDKAEKRFLIGLKPVMKVRHLNILVMYFRGFLVGY